MRDKVIKLKFTDQWHGHVPENDWYLRILRKRFNVELSENPDYIIDGGYEHEFLNYPDAIRIENSVENILPDFNAFDYAIGFEQELHLGDRYVRAPLFMIYNAFYQYHQHKFGMTEDELLNRDFCSFVVSNPGADPLRTEFFHKLSKYRPVASGGRYLNNVGGPVKSKLEFCAKYKFNIAFENSASPGYTSEKVLEPLTVNSVPIYYGNPFVGEDVHEECMVRIKDRSDVDRAIEEIVYLDTHDEAYLKKCAAPKLVHDEPDYYENLVLDFFEHIFSQPKEQARRLVPYGWQYWHRKHYEEMCRRSDLLTLPKRFYGKLRIKLGLQK